MIQGTRHNSVFTKYRTARAKQDELLRNRSDCRSSQKQFLRQRSFVCLSLELMHFFRRCIRATGKEFSKGLLGSLPLNFVFYDVIDQRCLFHITRVHFFSCVLLPMWFDPSILFVSEQ